jgi:hypothetical protein
MLPLAGIEPGLLTMTALRSGYSTLQRFIFSRYISKISWNDFFPGHVYKNIIGRFSFPDMFLKYHETVTFSRHVSRNIMNGSFYRHVYKISFKVPDMIPAFHMEIFPSARKITAH